VQFDQVAVQRFTKSGLVALVFDSAVPRSSNLAASGPKKGYFVLSVTSLFLRNKITLKPETV
jgi:hypothetical protein